MWSIMTVHKNNTPLIQVEHWNAHLVTVVPKFFFSSTSYLRFTELSTEVSQFGSESMWKNNPGAIGFERQDAHFTSIADGAPNSIMFVINP
jgi:hypothetical protein